MKKNRRTKKEVHDLPAERLFPHCMRSQKGYSPLGEGTGQLVLDFGVILQYLVEETKFKKDSAHVERRGILFIYLF